MYIYTQKRPNVGPDFVGKHRNNHVQCRLVTIAEWGDRAQMMEVKIPGSVLR